MTEVAQATRTINLKDAITEAIREEMERDERVFLLGEDIQDPFGGVFQITLGLSTKFGHKRVVETPISEAAIVGTAIGAAMAGLRPIAEIMIIDFLGVCMDQLYNQAAKLRYMSGGQVTCPIVIRTESGAGGGFGAQHSQSLEAWVCHVPGLKVVMPSTAADAKGLMTASIRDEDPVVFIENLHLYWTRGECPTGEHVVPLGRAAVRREGADCTIVSWGRMALESGAAAEELAGDGIECEVIDPRTLVPFDWETLLGSVRKTGRLVVVHEAVERGGYGAEVAARVQAEAWDALKGPIRRVAAANTPVPYAKPLETEMLPQRSDVVAAVKAAVGEVSGVERVAVVTRTAPGREADLGAALEAGRGKLAEVLERHGVRELNVLMAGPRVMAHLEGDTREGIEAALEELRPSVADLVERRDEPAPLYDEVFAWAEPPPGPFERAGLILTIRPGQEQAYLDWLGGARAVLEPIWKRNAIYRHDVLVSGTSIVAYYECGSRYDVLKAFREPEALVVLFTQLAPILELDPTSPMNVYEEAFSWRSSRDRQPA